MKKGYQEVKTTLSADEANQMIEKVARFIVEKQMGSAGILLLESLHPLHGIASQAMYFILPFAEMVFDSQKYQHFALMIQDEAHLKRLIKRIDELDEELNRERRAEAKLRRLRRRNQRKAVIRRIFKKDDKSAE
ncbi:MAG: hypothetical protein LHW45_01870 [Candidatus Cloacimonetes bacterium]|jgi:hypothetical protein|nr:hypothetical protein [Candidatus Cloacimonadota bacterium]MDD3144061.1 hypothetical protein [Candidatus Cloacimonadota bacterium]MDY0366361.1 hypothetical protein [Candidatus Syntrophosphaera sp.]HOY84489.1 hypothetical protein [Candidatus Syntrophosphaera sp.]HPH60867.1 hypothetical protein [Candidatus Syntrophosphaera sp.]